MLVRLIPPSALFALAVAAGCSAGAPPEDEATDRAPMVVGENELTPVAADGSNLDERYRASLDAFGLMRMDEGRNHCTVTHVGGGIVVTAGHCLDAPRTRIDDVPCPPGITIAWGLRAERAPYLTSTCERILAMRQDRDTDYAIFRVSPAPTAAVRPDLSARPALGRTITVFSHPRHRPLEWSRTCRVRALPADATGGRDEFLHECDTEPASSGATVLDDTTLTVVGIHGGAWLGVNYATHLVATPLAELTRATSSE